MRKFFISILLISSLSAVAAETVPNPFDMGSKVKMRPRVNNSSFLHVQEGVSASEKLYKRQYFPEKEPKPEIAAPPMKPSDKPDRPNKRPLRHAPVVYGFQYYDKDKDNNPQVINNTYNIYNAPSENKPAAKEQPKQKTQAQKDKEERQALRQQYSYILSNKTQSNEKMCSEMASCFPKADKKELDRVLNHLLYLNCDIEKLR